MDVAAMTSAKTVHALSLWTWVRLSTVVRMRLCIHCDPSETQLDLDHWQVWSVGATPLQRHKCKVRADTSHRAHGRLTPFGPS
jgi:hypothetical protein